MNYRMIFRITGRVLQAEAILMALAAIVAVVYAEDAVWSFLIVIAATFLIGMLLAGKKPADTTIFAREGFLIVGLSWLALSLFGCLPFLITREIPSFFDAFFETVSGFTTTGSSILLKPELLSKSLLFWRSFTHWIGGMGVLVFVMSIVNLAGGGRSMHLMRAEVPGPSKAKIVPKMRQHAAITYLMYLGLTMIEVVLLCFKMPLFDSLLYSFGTAGTGGFSISSAGFAAYNSVYVDIVVTVFMLLFSLNFQIYFLLLLRQFKTAFKNEEMWTFLGVVFVSITVITFNILPMYGGFGEALTHSSFQVSSIISTTGYTTADFNLWPTLSKSILVLLMFIGACAGSTGGGIKVSRILILIKSARLAIKRKLHPRSVAVVKLNGRTVDEETVENANVYIVLYLLIFCASVLLISLEQSVDFETSFTSVAATLNNIGPGLGAVGPAASFGGLSNFSKVVLSLDMLFGRLELFPMLMLLLPGAWRNR